MPLIYIVLTSISSVFFVLGFVFIIKTLSSSTSSAQSPEVSKMKEETERKDSLISTTGEEIQAIRNEAAELKKALLEHQAKLSEVIKDLNAQKASREKAKKALDVALAETERLKGELSSKTETVNKEEEPPKAPDVEPEKSDAEPAESSEEEKPA